MIYLHRKNLQLYAAALTKHKDQQKLVCWRLENASAFSNAGISSRLALIAMQGAEHVITHTHCHHGPTILLHFSNSTKNIKKLCNAN